MSKNLFRFTLFSAIFMLAATSLHAEDASLPKWLLTTKLGGDFRYRHEMIDRDSAPETRYRHRIRYRLWLKSTINDKTTVTFRLASGGTTPNSLEQDLTGGASGKPISLNQAFAEYKPAPEFTVLAGKFMAPYYSSPIIWDTDVNLEGLAGKWTSASKKLAPFATAGGYWLQEYNQTADQGLTAFQGGVTGKSDKITWKAAAAYHDFINVEHMPLIYDLANSFGNKTVTLDSAGPKVYANDFDLIDGLVSAAFKLGDAQTLTVTGHFVNNMAADSLNTGYLFGLDFATKASKTPLAFHYDYRNVEADATLGIFTDSSPGGGRTDINGHLISATAGIDENVDLNLIFMSNKISPDGADEQYTRTELQALFKF